MAYAYPAKQARHRKGRGRAYKHRTPEYVAKVQRNAKIRQGLLLTVVLVVLGWVSVSVPYAAPVLGIAALLGVLVGLRRLIRHPGDRHRPMVDRPLVPSVNDHSHMPPPEDPEPVVEPVAVLSPGEAPAPPVVKSRRGVRATEWMIGAMALLWMFGHHSAKQLAKARAMDDDIHEQLQIPGPWNNYQRIDPIRRN